MTLRDCPRQKPGDRAAGASAGRWRPKTRDGLALSAAAACSALDARTAREGAATKRPLIQGSPQPRRLLSLQGKSSVPLRLRHTFGVGRSLVTACRNFVATFKEDSLRICDTRYRLDRPPAEKPAALLLTVPATPDPDYSAVPLAARVTDPEPEDHAPAALQGRQRRTEGNGQSAGWRRQSVSPGAPTPDKLCRTRIKR